MLDEDTVEELISNLPACWRVSADGQVILVAPPEHFDGRKFLDPSRRILRDSSKTQRTAGAA